MIETALHQDIISQVTKKINVRRKRVGLTAKRKRRVIRGGTACGGATASRRTWSPPPRGSGSSRRSRVAVLARELFLSFSIYLFLDQYQNGFSVLVFSEAAKKVPPIVVRPLRAVGLGGKAGPLGKKNFV